MLPSPRSSHYLKLDWRPDKKLSLAGGEQWGEQKIRLGQLENHKTASVGGWSSNQRLKKPKFGHGSQAVMEFTQVQILLEQQGAEEKILPWANAQVPGWRSRGQEWLFYLQSLQKSTALLQRWIIFYTRQWEIDQNLARCDPRTSSTSPPTSASLDDRKRTGHDLGHRWMGCCRAKQLGMLGTIGLPSRIKIWKHHAATTSSRSRSN